MPQELIDVLNQWHEADKAHQPQPVELNIDNDPHLEEVVDQPEDGDRFVELPGAAEPVVPVVPGDPEGPPGDHEWSEEDEDSDVQGRGPDGPPNQSTPMRHCAIISLLRGVLRSTGVNPRTQRLPQR